MEEEKEYKGFWKNIGCVLSAFAIFGILALIITMAYQFFSGS